jgi:hypothetical protein
MVFSLWLYQTTKSTMTQNTRQTGAILIAMRMQRCYAGRIAQWSTSVASRKTTRCCYSASAHTVFIAPAAAMVDNFEKKKKLT